MKKGSVSIFFAMTFLSLASFFLVLAEGVRMQAFAKTLSIRDEETQSYLESMYHQKLWKDYGILGLDSKFGHETSDELVRHVKDYISSDSSCDKRGMNYYISDIVLLSTKNEVYLTDSGGEAFFDLALEAEKEQFLKKGLNKLSDELQKGFKNNEKMDLKSIIEKGQKALKDVKPEETKESKDDEVENKYPKKDWSNTENPMDVAKNRDSEADLSFWIGDDKHCSEKNIDLKALYSFDSNERCRDRSPLERLIFSEYAFDYFGNYLEERKAGALAYGAEYLLMGKESDEANLKAVIKRLLALREIQNAIAIKTHPALDMEAGSLATSMCLLIGNPGIIEVVKMGIIASWAYVESVLDIRALLRGKTIPIQKTAESFTSDLATLGTYLAKDKYAKEVKIGLDYKMSLRALYMIENVTRINERALGLINLEVNKDKLYSGFQIQKVLVECDLCVKYQTSDLFLGYANLKNKKEKTSYERTVHFSFIT